MTTNAKGDRLDTGRKADWKSISIFFALMILGWFTIYAAVFDESATVGFSLDTRYGSQLIWMGICVLTATVIMFIDDIYYHILAYPAYTATLIVLALTIFIGKEVNGARSWIRLGGFSIQPAEFAKITTALAMARLISSYHFSLTNVRNLISLAFIIGAPIVLILLQNDTGSAMVYLAFVLVLFREGLNGWMYVAIGMMIFLFVFSFLLNPVALLASTIIICTVVEGLIHRRWKNNAIYIAGIALFSILSYLVVNILLRVALSFYYILLIVSVLSTGLVALYAYFFKLRKMVIPITLFIGSLLFTGTVDYVFDNVLQVHQQKRILNLLGVESDLQKWGYNVNQSKIAIGSGGFAGKGFLQGTQTKYDFVPEQSTDFIFCTIGEEYGFIGSLVVLGFFCTLIIRLIVMGERQEEPFGRVYCYCVAAIFLFHVAINIGMTIGIMPVIGIPLPLFSYGGSSLLAFTILFFIAVKLDSKKRETEETFRK